MFVTLAQGELCSERKKAYVDLVNVISLVICVVGHGEVSTGRLELQASNNRRIP